MIFARLSHALSLNDICDCLRFHKGYLAQIRDCVPPSRNGLAHANATRNAALAEELFWSVLAEVKSKHPKFISGDRPDNCSGCIFPFRLDFIPRQCYINRLHLKRNIFGRNRVGT